MKKHPLLLIFIISLVVSFLVDYFWLMDHKHGEYFWSHVPGFFALFGFVGCVLIIIVSKWLGHHWLQRKEDYYDNHDRDD